MKNALGFSASSWSLSSSSNLARTAELPAWDEFDFPFQLVKHKCEAKTLNIEEKPGYETKTSRFVQTAHWWKANGHAELSMLTLTVAREFGRTGPANSEGDYSDVGLFSNNECTATKPGNKWSEARNLQLLRSLR